MIALIASALAGAFFAPLEPLHNPEPPRWTPESHPHLFADPCPATDFRMGEAVSPQLVDGIALCNGQLSSRRALALAEWKVDVELVFWQRTARALHVGYTNAVVEANATIDERDRTIKALKRARTLDGVKLVLVVTGAAIAAGSAGYVAGRLGL